jgi:NADPH2:quinone reductase
MKLPFTPGQDIVGTIVQLPKSKTTSTALPALELGQTVMSPINNAFAEYAVAPWWKVAPIPKGVEPKYGVPATTTALTMAYLVKESYEVKKGDWVLVRAAAGGVGLLLCQVSPFPFNHDGKSIEGRSVITKAQMSLLPPQTPRKQN